MSKGCKIALLGATGAVGQEMLKILEEYQIPVERLLPLAGARSAGGSVRFRGEALRVEEASPERFAGMDFVLGAVEAEHSRRFAPAIRQSGAVYIDNSSAFRLDPVVPLVVPEINGSDAFTHRGVIANPNCSTVITLMAVAGIAALSPIRSMTVCTYQAVSGAGQKGLDELKAQMLALSRGQTPAVSAFPAQIALNVIPWIGEETPNGYTDEEMKLQNEGRRILHSPALRVGCTCVRVPVQRSHSIAVSVRTEDAVSVEAARAAIRAFPGVRLLDETDALPYPTPLDSTGQDLVLVGRVREDLSADKSLSLWCCGDQLRKGAAANAVQILRLLWEV